MKLLDVRHLSMWIHDGQEEKQMKVLRLLEKAGVEKAS